MDELPITSEELILGLAKVFKEENSSQLLKRIKEGTLEEYLGTRKVIEYLEGLLERSLSEDMEV